MERHSFAMELKEGKKNDYRRKLGEIWPELTAFLDQEKVHNFSIWNCDSLIFGYYETDENHEFSEEKKAQIQALTARIEDTFHLDLHSGGKYAPDVPQLRRCPRKQRADPPQNVHDEAETWLRGRIQGKT